MQQNEPVGAEDSYFAEVSRHSGEREHMKKYGGSRKNAGEIPRFLTLSFSLHNPWTKDVKMDVSQCPQVG
jgi:hypothetical protein